MKALWIKRGVYLLIIKLNLIATRNLCKKVLLIFRQEKPSAKPNVSLDWFLKAFKFSDKNEYEQNEVACIISNLLYFGFMRGYIFKN